MAHFFMIALISCFALGTMAGTETPTAGECDSAYGDCPSQGTDKDQDKGQEQDQDQDKDKDQDQSQDQEQEAPSSDYGTWVCYADNMIVKGFIGVSSDKDEAMDIAMARCENNSQLPCFPILCRQE